MVIVQAKSSQRTPMLVSALFRQFDSCFGFLTLQDKYNIYIVKKKKSFALVEKQDRKLAKG
jgi:hypothetical protein